MSSLALPFPHGIDPFFEAAPAAGDVGRSLRAELAKIQREFSDRASNWGSSVGAALAEIGLACSEPNWDGYGARPVTVDVLKRASSLSSSLFAMLPSGIPAPDAVPEADGDVALSWTRDRQRLFSVSIGEDDQLSFAGILAKGVERHGVEGFDGTDPSVLQEIARYVARLYGR